ncbi:MAG: flagella basal body P-ring formation protein FlgA [Sandarakinorhabdus sp.]|nr:flagella basal body P-ring formation protein FlgA [Sandarakinorhabdus sp.]
MPIMTLVAGLLGLMAPSVLQTQVEAFSGQTAMVDPRLLLPACARPDFAWGAGGHSVVAHCAAPEWRVFVPVGQRGAVVPPVPVALPSFTPRPDAEAPAVRRGDRVTLEVGGDGFVIGMDAVAEADAKDGRVPVRAAAGGRRLTGAIGADGRVRLRALSSMVNGR